MSVETAALEAVLKRDRAIVVAGLIVVSAVSWLYVLAGAGMDMHSMDMHGMNMPTVWTPGYVLLMLAMWWIMMVAMMLPSAAPMVLLFAAITRQEKARNGVQVPAGVFAAGYVLAWGGFSLVAVVLQWGLERLTLMSPMMATNSVALGAVLLIAAGVYQLTPLKHACLRHCRSPVEFLAGHWQAGAAGALRMGFAHGSVCLGCCWVPMALLFYGGVMNPWWIGGLALYVLIEKLAPTGPNIGRFTGLLLILWGLWLLMASLIDG